MNQARQSIPKADRRLLSRPQDSRYADGLLYMDEALRCLPQSMHMPLLEYKVLFASKLGRDVEAEMLRVANFTPAAQAKVWLVLATESISTDAQLEGRQKAIDVLKNEPWSQAEYLVELAEYLLYNERNQQMARDTLLEAASLYIRSDHTKLLGEVHTMDLFSVSGSLSRRGTRVDRFPVSVSNSMADRWQSTVDGLGREANVWVACWCEAKGL